MAHNLFHANYGDYKKSSPDTAVLLLLSKVTQKHFRQPYRPSKVPLRPAGGYPAVRIRISYSGILARIYSRSPQYGVPTRYHSLAGFISILVCTH